MGLHAYLLRSFSRVASSLWDAQIVLWIFLEWLTSQVIQTLY